MNGVTNYELFNSLKIDIDKKLETIQKRLENVRSKAKDNDKAGLFAKMSVKSDMKHYENQLTSLTMLNNAIFDLQVSDSDKYTLPEELKSLLEQLSTLLPSQDALKLSAVVNECLRDANRDKREKIKQVTIRIQNLLKDLNLGGKDLLIYGNNGQYKGSTVSFDRAIKSIESTMLSNLMPEHTFIGDKENLQSSIATEDEALLDTIAQMAKNGELNNDKATKNIVDNLNSIKVAMIAKKKAEDILLVITNMLTQMTEVTDFDLTKLQNYLQQLKAFYQKEADRYAKFLAKFDLTSVKEQALAKQQEKEASKTESTSLMDYQNLAYELEKTMQESPDNYEKISDIKNAMADIARRSSISDSELEQAITEGKAKYNNQIYEQKVTATVLNEDLAQMSDEKRDAMQALRDFAIQELEQEGAFNVDYEFRNGDAYSKSLDREALITKKIQELQRLAEMKPEERGLEDLKKHGNISESTKLEDLSHQLIEDLKVAYRDETYSFMKPYKEWQNSELKPKANTIYKEYIKYRASLPDKTNYLTFSEYAKQLHNIAGLTETMVDTDILDETEGMSR